MVHSCKKINCPYRNSKKKGKTMRGGSCGCNKSATNLFSGGKRRKTNKRRMKRRKIVRGGSAGLSSLLSSSYYPQNDYVNDMSDPSKQIAGRFTDVPSMRGGYRHPSSKPIPGKTKKMQGGAGMFSSNNFLGTFGNSSGINNLSSTWLGANNVNPPSYLQNAASVYTDNTNSGYNAQNPYLV